MAESKFQILSNGTELQIADINQVSDEAAYADDRVIAEFLRMPPFDGSTVIKGIIPFSEDRTVNSGTDVIGNDPFSTIAPSGASNRTVIVRPFRALIGPRAAVATDSKKNWRDVRSNIFLGSTTTRNGSVQLNAADPTNARWDLIYAAVAVDANASGVVRYFKDPTTSIVTSPTVVTNLVTTITVDKVTGTAAATPALPTIPADSAGVYYVPLAYVKVSAVVAPGLSWAVNVSDVLFAAPCVPISRATGVSTVRPANGQYKPNQAGTSAANTNPTGLAAWANTNVAPTTYLSPNSVGSEKLLIALDLSNASDANWSVQKFGLIDDTRDWRKRLWFGWAQSINKASVGTAHFAWAASGSPIPNANLTVAISGTTQGTHICSGQSFLVNMSGVSGFSGTDGYQVFKATQDQLDFNASTTIYIYVSDTDGALRFFYTGGPPRALVFVCLEGLGPLGGY